MWVDIAIIADAPTLYPIQAAGDLLQYVHCLGVAAINVGGQCLFLNEVLDDLVCCQRTFMHVG